MGYLITMHYDSEGRIEEIVDKHALLDFDNFPGWTVYEYDIAFQRDHDALRRVTDPLNLKQEFQAAYDGNFSFHVNHTDKRGNVWVYDSNPAVNNVRVRSVTNPLGEKSTFQYDNDWNLLQCTDPLNNTWTNTYDDRGNKLTAASPLHDPSNFWHRQDWTYDNYPPGHALQGQVYNNVTSYTDAAGNETTYHYDERGYPTLLTSFVEPDDGQGNGPATTRITYYLAPYSADTCDTPGECRHGQIESVTDPNGVLTGFDYDIWGQLTMYGEGTTDGGATFIYQVDMTNDSASRTVTTFTSGTASRAEVTATRP